MKFSIIIAKIKNGKARAARKAWGGKMFVYMEVGKNIPLIKLREPQKSWLGKDMVIADHLNLFDGSKIITGYSPSVAELYAEDWELLIPCQKCKVPLTLAEIPKTGYLCKKCAAKPIKK